MVMSSVFVLLCIFKPNFAFVLNSASSNNDLDSDYYYDSTNLNTLKMAQVIFRHGARTPLNPFPTDPNADFDYGVKGKGQLIQKGKQQAFELGNYLRKRYDGFVSPTYDLDQVYIQSSDADRTIMTAQMCLTGLFSPASNVQPDLDPIPIHALPKRIDNKIAFDAPCPKHAQLQTEYMNSKLIRAFDSSRDWIYKLVSKKSGLNVTNFRELQWLTDTFMVQEQNGLTLPSWTRHVYPDQTQAGFRLEFITESATSEMQRLLLSPLVTDLIRNMYLATTNSLAIPSIGRDLEDYHNRSSKLYLYSGHDMTLSAFLNSFQIYDYSPPNYVSAVLIELHQDDAAASEGYENVEDYIIKIFYKKKRRLPIQQLELPACRNPCRLPVFEKSYKQFLMDYSQWTDFCNL